MQIMSTAKSCEAGTTLAHTPLYFILTTPISIIMPIFADQETEKQRSNDLSKVN